MHIFLNITQALSDDEENKIKLKTQVNLITRLRVTHLN